MKADKRILNYDCCRLLWKSCRFPAKGKPMPVAGCRLYKEGDNFVLFRYSERVATINPDSMFTLYAQPSGMMQTALFTIFRMRMRRISSGKYEVGLQRTQENKDGRLPRFFSGVCFDMFSHKCVNEHECPPDPVRVRDTDKLRPWQRSLRAYIKGWKVRAKIGALANDIDKHLPTIQGVYNPMQPVNLAAAIESQEYGLAAALIVHHAVSWWDAKRAAEVGWENFVRERQAKGYEYRLADMFERVYRRHREDIYRLRGIVKIEQPPRLNPAL